ncbi:MAG: spore cortex biosynthesis protein YabQ [Clostridia bacterium]
MAVSEQLLNFFEFVVIGMIISLIFDFFRSYRRYKKVTIKVLVLHDIIYFVIFTTLITLGVAYLLKTSIRFYIFIALICGFGIYISVFSSHIIKIYSAFFEILHNLSYFCKLPIELILQIIQKNCKITYKILKKCCKMFLHMVFLIRSKINLKFKIFLPNCWRKKIKTKEVSINEKEVQF